MSDKLDYSLKMNFDDTEAFVRIAGQSPLTRRMIIGALRNLAEDLERRALSGDLDDEEQDQ